MSEVVLSNLVKEYRDGKKNVFRAVKGIDLTIREREFMVLVGPSGCGKSTSLRMIAGLEEITGGTISIGGRVVNNIAPKDRDIAMVFQNYALYPHMSVFDNMAFGLKLMKYPTAEIKQRVNEAAEILGLTTMLERKPKALSGGQRQRVAVGRAIVRKPKVFLFDEPLSNLDAKMRVQMRTEISKLHSRLNATMIYVTHDQVEAMTMGTRICVMKDGEIQQVDEPLKLYNAPQNVFTAGFIGSPPMNFFRGKVEVLGAEVRFTEEAAAGAAGFSLVLGKSLADKVRSTPGKVVIFGIRPEDISVSAVENTQVAASSERASMPAQAIISAKVEVSEPMGAETYLYLTSGSHSFIARVHAQDRFNIGTGIRVQINLDKAHLFDAETQKVIATAQADSTGRC